MSLPYLLNTPAVSLNVDLRDRQVLVYHDMLGMLQHPHHEQFVPRFCKSYGSIGEEVG